MQKLDLPALAGLLNALAETFDKKAVGAKALEVWFDTLREFAWERVVGLLQSWPKTHAKFPVPAEVWKILNDFSTQEREAKARSEKAEFARGFEYLGKTERGAQYIAEIAEILKRPKRTPIEHWRNVLATPGLPPISYEFANAALAKIDHRRERQPGEDFEEDEAASRPAA